MTQVVRDGETVFVSLHSARELDSVGAVSMSSFELDAFQKGRHAEAVKKMRSAEASHHRRITSLMQRLRDGARGVHANAKMEETMGVGNPSDRTKTLDAMFAADWATLRMPRRYDALRRIESQLLLQAQLLWRRTFFGHSAALYSDNDNCAGAKRKQTATKSR
jgi:hypothetical protein